MDMSTVRCIRIDDYGNVLLLVASDKFLQTFLGVLMEISI